jgi:hypothetical protein
MRRMVYPSQYIFERSAPRLCTLLHMGRITLETPRSARRIHWLLSFSEHFFALAFLLGTTLPRPFTGVARFLGTCALDDLAPYT